MLLAKVNFEIAFAHLFNRRRQSLVSVLGVALGVGFFIATSSLMQGSENDFVGRLVDSQPHITVKDEFREPARQPVFMVHEQGAVSLKGVKPREYLRGVKDYAGKLDQLRAVPGVIAAPALSGASIVRYGGEERNVTVLGIDPDVEPRLTTIEEDMREGSLDALKTTANGIVIGRGLSDILQLKIGDLASVIAPSGNTVLMKVVGIFRAGNILLDEGQAYVLLKDAQVLLNKPNIADRVRIKLPDPNQALAFSRQLEQRWGYKAESWQEVNEDILGLFVVRNAILYAIVGAIMVVASFGIFNIISTVVMEKRRDIAILMSMGFRAADIRAIFLVQGFLVGVIGMLLGWAVGWGLISVLASIEFDVEGLIDAQGFPLDFGLTQFAIGGAFALVSAVAAAWLPAHKASQVRPVDIIRGAA